MAEPRIWAELLTYGLAWRCRPSTLIRAVLDDGAAPAWSGAVDRFAAMPLPLLLLISSVTEVVSPDDLLLFAKSAAVILAAQLPLQKEIAFSIGFSGLMLN